MTIIKHELKANLKTMLIWAFSIGAIILAVMLMFPMMEEQLIEMGDLFSNMEGLSAALGLDQLSIYSAIGYYGSQVGVVLSLGGALFTAMLGADILSKEEAGHTAEFLLAFPISRANVVFQKLIAMIVVVFTFELICFSMATLSFVLIGESIPMPEFLLYHLAQFYLHIQIAFICFGISSFSKKANTGLALGIVTILYFTDIMIKTVENLEFLKYVTPFYYAGAGDIFSSGKIDSFLVFIGLIVSIFFVIVSCVKYSKKDIAA
ncbi:ABC transporter permease subunit [Alkalibaculum sp. M08DMB]|uniref:ABC transporter permease subunit n=1 Tax=Alkalibaculum sporogenes TaxID=2655001 RepID=A0A6A7K7N5_9FIRM|nr:ABC transporter permease subunit [Alkalibaculum sporogenes]MPW25498.1 ABC transporter permease subunit [Alkalibaculum sporogenes]